MAATFNVFLDDEGTTEANGHHFTNIDEARIFADEMSDLGHAVFTDFDFDGRSVTTPVAGDPFTDKPGYVVGRCGHAVAGSEWKAGFRVCERCPSPATV